MNSILTPIPARTWMIVIGLILGSVVQARADTLARYTFTGSSLATSDSDGNSVASAITVNSNSTKGFSTGGQSAGTTAASAPVYYFRTDGTAATEGAADDYLQFTLTVGSGFTADLAKIGFDHGATAGSDSDNIISNWQIRYSFDGFATTTATIGTSTVNVSPGANQSANYIHYEIGLDGISALQSIGANSTVTFRLYAFDNLSGTSSTSGVNRIDNIQVDGVVAASAVPEPSACVLVAGLTGLAVAGSRRRRREA